MNDCTVCDKAGWYICRSCKINLCKDHKSMHEKSKKGDHICEKANINLTSEHIVKIVENLSGKIKAVNDCRSRIINATIALIDKIQAMSAQAIKLLKVKQKKYTFILSRINDQISHKELKEIELQLKIILKLNVPNRKFEELEKFYELDFLKEFGDNKPIKLVELLDSSCLVSEDYDLVQQKVPFKATSSIITIDSKYIVFGSEKNLKIWNLKDQALEADLNGHDDDVTAISVSSDKKFIFSGSRDRSVRAWSIQDKNQEAELWGHTDYVSSVAATSDNKYIISGGADTNVIIWNFILRRQEAILMKHNGCVSKIIITSDDKYIVSGSNNDFLIFWNLQTRTYENSTPHYRFLLLLPRKLFSVMF